MELIKWDCASIVYVYLYYTSDVNYHKYFNEIIKCQQNTGITNRKKVNDNVCDMLTIDKIHQEKVSYC